MEWHRRILSAFSAPLDCLVLASHSIARWATPTLKETQSFLLDQGLIISEPIPDISALASLGSRPGPGLGPAFAGDSHGRTTADVSTSVPNKWCLLMSPDGLKRSSGRTVIATAC